MATSHLQDFTVNGEVPQPFVRWAGGKRQLLDRIHAALPANFDLTTSRFFEPFVGGGAVLWSLASHPSTSALKLPKTKKRQMVINDVNWKLTTAYSVVRDDIDNLVDRLKEEAKDVSQDRYYEVRAQDPATLSDLEVAVWFLYLNACSFNGLWRESGFEGRGGKVKMNVPWGKLANPNVCVEDRLRACSRFLQNVEIRNGSHISAVADLTAGDVLYLDPPYLPVSKTASFAKYSHHDFQVYDQYALAGVIRGLTEDGIRIVFSNSNTELTRKIYGDLLDLRDVAASRSVGASSSTRVKVSEVLGINFDVSDTADPALFGALPQA